MQIPLYLYYSIQEFIVSTDIQSKFKRCKSLLSRIYFPKGDINGGENRFLSFSI